MNRLRAVLSLFSQKQENSLAVVPSDAFQPEIYKFAVRQLSHQSQDCGWVHISHQSGSIFKKITILRNSCYRVQYSFHGTTLKINCCNYHLNEMMTACAVSSTITLPPWIQKIKIVCTAE